MTCTCGFQNVDGAAFCGRCGSPLGQAAGTAVKPNRRRRASWAKVALLVVVAGVAATTYWWMQRPPGPYVVDNSGLYAIEVDGKHGYMDRSGNVVIAPQFDNTNGFSEGRAAVLVGSKWGYIDTGGRLAVTRSSTWRGTFGTVVRS